MKMRRGFTMVELMVVIGIIAILVTVLVSSFGGSVDSARSAQCKGNMRKLAIAHQALKVLPVSKDSGFYSPSGDLGAKCPLAARHGGSRPYEGSWIDYDMVGNPYVSGHDRRLKILSISKVPPPDNREYQNNLWVSIKGDMEAFVCPVHRQYAKKKNLGDPLWSYAMNGWFGCGGIRTGDGYCRKFDSISRPERLLLFAELPVMPLTVAGEEIQDGNLSGAALDPALDYKAGETIGFNHLSDKKAAGNVAFFDGHVEQFLAPKNKGNIKELTEWLCDGDDMDFDIGFDGESYDKVQ